MLALSTGDTGAIAEALSCAIVQNLVASTAHTLFRSFAEWRGHTKSEVIGAGFLGQHILAEMLLLGSDVSVAPEGDALATLCVPPLSLAQLCVCVSHTPTQPCDQSASRGSSQQPTHGFPQVSGLHAGSENLPSTLSFFTTFAALQCFVVRLPGCRSICVADHVPISPALLSLERRSCSCSYPLQPLADLQLASLCFVRHALVIARPELDR